MSSHNITPLNLTNATITVKQTRDEIAALLAQYLERINKTYSDNEQFLIYQKLKLQHPLSDGDGDGDTDDSAEETLAKVSQSLLILFDLLKKVNWTPKVDNFTNIIEKVEHNLSKALEMRNLHFSAVETPPYTYNRVNINEDIVVIMETIAILNVVEAKYERLLGQLNCQSSVESQS
ncbi:hypothetical protein KR093_009445 [Drosophila rubida]|uniref:Ciliary neurotrophic factor n=1 Tax=Drosophila rubida TaxID=30044 RepID=A0AAD4KEN8_9MUSC|nr:hypothetical protein KR093_009445 [Drosophila rubida]